MTKTASLGYKIVIPTYKRSVTVGLKTLAYLQECNINMADVYLFVASQEEYALYNKYRRDLGINLIIGVPTLRAQRNFISQYFADGQQLVQLDDDIEALYVKVDDKKYTKVLNLNNFFIEAFNTCVQNNTKLWGVGAVLNALFMKDKVSTDLRLIVGCFWGCINDASIHLSLDEKEDYERSILYYNKYKKIVRFNAYAPKTKFYKEGGGMQEHRTVEHSHQAADYLIKTYPNYVKLNTKRKGDRAEARLYHNPKKDVVTQPTLF